MKLFNIIKYQTDIQLIGTFEQIKGFNLSHQEVKAHQFGYLSEIERIEDLPNLHHFALDAKAKITDGLTNNMISMMAGLLISEKCKKLFDQFNVKAKFHTASVHTNSKKILPYFYMEIKYIPNSINFEKSDFEIRKELFKQSFGMIKIIDYDDFIAKSKEVYLDSNTKGSSIIPLKLVMNETLDIFRYPMQAGILCSQDLQKAIMSENITGFTFNKANWVIEYS